ncbi:MAG: hypothetical protein HOE90_12940 [Bacteriovoracaceae bacterium]|jgi:hypothetical protein|nr:hypothetical protein [Bacteriovoracaceae bacterium]
MAKKIAIVLVLLLVAFGIYKYFFGAEEAPEEIVEVQKKIKVDTEEVSLGDGKKPAPKAVVKKKVVEEVDPDNIKLEATEVKRIVEVEVAKNRKFLEKCEENVDNAFEDLLDVDPDEFYEDELLIQQALEKMRRMQLNSPSMSRILEVTADNPKGLDDKWLVEQSMDLRPCRPFMRMEFMGRLLDGVGEEKWTPEFSDQIKSFVLLQIKDGIQGESRMFSIGLYSSLLNKMVKLGMVDSQFESDLKRIEDQVRDYTENLRNQVDVRDAEDVGGAVKWFSQDVKEARRIRDEMNEIYRSVEGR